MSPLQALKFLEEGPREGLSVPIEGTEPYVLGGHTASGYWVDGKRETTLAGLFAAGDVAGGSPQKYVSGAMAEAAIAARSAVSYLAAGPRPPREALREAGEEARALVEKAASRLGKGVPSDISPAILEGAMQEAMDSLAGGLSADYRYSQADLAKARAALADIGRRLPGLGAADMRELMEISELEDRLEVASCLIAHLEARKETRWPGFGEYTDFPSRDADGFDRYVNTRLVGGRREVILRPLWLREEGYEHSH
jgi:adenylylsulfate reductase subunit A